MPGTEPSNRSKTCKYVTPVVFAICSRRNMTLATAATYYFSPPYHPISYVVVAFTTLQHTYTHTLRKRKQLIITKAGTHTHTHNLLKTETKKGKEFRFSYELALNQASHPCIAYQKVLAKWESLTVLQHHWKSTFVNCQWFRLTCCLVPVKIPNRLW